MPKIRRIQNRFTGTGNNNFIPDLRATLYKDITKFLNILNG